VFQKHLSYANVIGSVALFVALGGTAAAAATLTRDSVGAPQIRKDAVRSPEIQADAVRSSEIRDESITLTDVAPGAATALRGDMHVAENDNDALDSVPACVGEDLSVCPDFVTLELTSGAGSRTLEPGASEPAGNWLVQAKADVRTFREVAAINRCGLVNTAATGPKAVLDEVLVHDDEDIALSAVVKKGAGDPTIALRCTRQSGSTGVDEIAPTNVKLTGLEVGSVTGP
jgi:hypothetical protein